MGFVKRINSFVKDFSSFINFFGQVNDIHGEQIRLSCVTKKHCSTVGRAFVWGKIKSTEIFLVPLQKIADL